MNESSQNISSDLILDGAIRLLQHKNGYRFSIDALLLSWFIKSRTASKEPLTVLEIGAGNGAVSITLKKRGFISAITCVELQASLFDLLSQNIDFNGYHEEILPVLGNFLDIKLPSSGFDIIFANPPYFRLTGGKICPDGEKAAARHEINGSLEDFFARSSKLLKKKGAFFLVYPLSRLQYAMSASDKHGLFCSEIVLVKDNPALEPSLFLAKFVNGLGKDIPSAAGIITIKDHNGEYCGIGKEVVYDIS